MVTERDWEKEKVLENIPIDLTHSSLNELNAYVYIDKYNRLCILMGDNWVGVDIDSTHLEFDAAPFCG